MNPTAPELALSLRAKIQLVLQSALPRPQKAVLQALLAYARPDLTVYHAQGQLAWACDYTRPTIKQALAALKARAILRVLRGPRQHYATEYAIDLSRLPRRAPYQATAVDGHVVVEDEAAGPIQMVNDVPSDDMLGLAQGARNVPAGSPAGKRVSPSGQLAAPQVVQVLQKKIIFSCDGSTPPGPSTGARNDSPPTAQSRRLRLTAPRARGDLRPPAVPVPARAPDPPPVYDPVLHAQMKADLARLERRFHAGGQASRRRREWALPLTEGAGVDDPKPRHNFVSVRGE